MTGRDLIIYILQNGLEDKPVFEDGRFIGFSTVVEAAEKMGVGIGTVYAWIAQNQLEGVLIKEGYYIPANSESPMKNAKG